MPLARYFLFVGGVLLALLFVIDAVQPEVPVAEMTVSETDMPIVRIQSDRKWPERVVYDTSLPTIVPPPTAQAELVIRPPAVAADVSAKARARETFAQVRPADEVKPAPKPRPKRKIAKARVARPMVLVAEQPRFGFGLFNNNTW